MEATTEILKEFMLFPKLPIELRHRIFSYIKTPYAETHVHAIRGFPANVLQDKASTRNPPKKPVEPALPSQLQWPNADYVWPKKKTPIAYLTWHLKGGRFLSTTAPAIHPLLQTCHESRKFFIDKFDLVPAFGTLFNLNRDILFLDASTAIHYAEVNNPGIEAFAELLRHPDLIKKIKRLAFHVQIQDYLWLGKCAEKIKGQLASLEELYLVWADDGRHQAVQKRIPKLTGLNLFFLDVTEEGFDREFQVTTSAQDQMRKDMEERWIKAVPDQKSPKKQAKIPKFRHVFAKNSVFGHTHGVTSFRQFMSFSSTPINPNSKAVQNAVAGI